MTNVTIVRRQNALALFRAFTEKALAGNASPKGLEQAFASAIQVSPSMWSQIKSSRPIGDKLARQIEKLCAQPAGWLDEARKHASPTAAEAAFLGLALAAWRASTASEKKVLRRQLRAMAERPSTSSE